MTQNHRFQPVKTASRGGRPLLWPALVLAAAAPVLVPLTVALWRTPYPVNEAVALFEDVQRQPPAQFLVPDTSYYRPLYHLSLSAIWHNAGPLERRLAWVKALHIAPIVLLVMLFIWHLRPRSGLEAAAAAVAVAVLIGSPGLRDNLEIPLSYTAVGMPLALAAWVLLNRERRGWHAPVVVALLALAVGFKEQGLVIVPLVIVAWWTRAPGASRGLAAAVTAFAAAYVLLRLQWRGSWPLFEQAMGLGFTTIEPGEAEARFGAFPYWMYAYNVVSTIANVLLAEPTGGVFRIVGQVVAARLEPWAIVYVVSSATLTILIGWWGARAVKDAVRHGWSAESRAFLAMIVVVLASGVLSFNYSRDRLGGMAVVFYALTAFFALRAAAARAASAAAGVRLVMVALMLTVVAASWQLRAIGTLEHVRLTSWRNERGWLTDLPRRRLRFADREVYLQIMESMIEQGTTPSPPRPTRYPPWVVRMLLP